ncbi:MAG: hypothetical protein ABSF32_03735 [Ignavibacteria bacterium]|jgi:hypothetical protein
MKKLYIVTVFLIFICNSLYAQNTVRIDTLRKIPFWSLSVIGGLIIPMGDFGNNFNTSIAAGFEISYHPIHHYAFFFNSQFDFLKYQDVNYSGHAGYIEVGAGARSYLGNAPEIFFVEAGIGDYIYYYTSAVTNNYTHFKGSFGIKAGIGGNMQFTDKILFLIKTDLHFIFTSGSKTYFPGIYGGLRFIL